MPFSDNKQQRSIWLTGVIKGELLIAGHSSSASLASPASPPLGDGRWTDVPSRHQLFSCDGEHFDPSPIVAMTGPRAVVTNWARNRNSRVRFIGRPISRHRLNRNRTFGISPPTTSSPSYEEVSLLKTRRRCSVPTEQEQGSPTGLFDQVATSNGTFAQCSLSTSWSCSRHVDREIAVRSVAPAHS